MLRTGIICLLAALCLGARAEDMTLHTWEKLTLNELFYSEGANFADFNGDGKIDVVVSSLGEPAELWENVTETDGEWIIIKLEGVKANRDGIGARIQWGSQWNVMSSAVGYASSSHFGVHFGAPKGQGSASLEVWWPGGKKQVVPGVASRLLSVVRELP